MKCLATSNLCTLIPLLLMGGILEGAGGGTVQYQIVSISNTQPGQFPSVTFAVTGPEANGHPVDIQTDPEFAAASSSLVISFGWDSSAARLPVVIRGLGSALRSAPGVYAVDATSPIPLGATGTGVVAIESDSAAPAYAFFQIGGGRLAQRHVVDRNRCDTCHSTIRAHGNIPANDLQLCTVCHAANSARGEFQSLIHARHAALNTCDSCHNTGTANDLRAIDASASCLSCHSDASARSHANAYGGGFNSSAARQLCADCHSAGAANDVQPSHLAAASRVNRTTHGTGMTAFATTGNTITLNPAKTYQSIRGWEATAQAGQTECSGFSGYQSAMFDGAVNDLGINRVRLEIRGTSSLTFNLAGMDQTIDMVVLPLRQRLQARGEKLWVNVNVVGSEFAGHPQEYAQQALAVYRHMQGKYGFVPDSWEAVLEPTVVSRNWTAAGLAATIQATATLLQSNGYTPYFVAPSMASAYTTLQWVSDMEKAVPGVMRYVKEISYHRYSGADSNLLGQMLAKAQSVGAGTAMLEHGGADFNELHADLKYGANVAWQQYTLAECSSDNGYQYYVANGSTATLGIRTKFLRQYMKYVRKGAVRYDAQTTNSTFDPLAFRNMDGEHVVVVKAAAGGTFTISGLANGTYGVFYTTGSGSSVIQYNVSLPDQSIGNGQLTTSIPSAGVITVYGKTAGSTAPPPPPAPAPAPPATPPADVTPPVRSNGSPSGQLAAGTTQVTISLSTNETATCRYSKTPGVAYSAMTGAFVAGANLTHTSGVSGLAGGNSYTYFVRCMDASGNANPDDYPIAFSVAAPVFSGSGYYQYLEAESAVLMPAMRAVDDAMASGKKIVRSYQNDYGSAAWTVNVPAAGAYAVWVRALTPLVNRGGSVYVSIDGGTEQLWTVSPLPVASTWTWVKISTNQCGALAAGSHTVRFRTHDLIAYLDQILVTNDLGFTPVGAGVVR